MPEANEEIVRHGIEAFNARDVDRMTKLFAPDVEIHSAFATAMAGQAVYHGHAGLRTWHQDLEETWGEIRLDLERVTVRGAHALTRCIMRGRGHTSGAEVEMPVAHVVAIRDGRVTWIRTYGDLDAASGDFEAAAGASAEAER